MPGFTKLSGVFTSRFLEIHRPWWEICPDQDGRLVPRPMPRKTDWAQGQPETRAVREEGLLELRLPSFACVLPTDEPDQVLHPGAGHCHHGHWQQSVLARVQGEVDVDLLRCCCAYMTLWTEHNAWGWSTVTVMQTLGGHNDCSRGLVCSAAISIVLAQTCLWAWNGPKVETLSIFKGFFFPFNFHFLMA